MKETYFMFDDEGSEDREKRHIFTQLQSNIYGMSWFGGGDSHAGDDYCEELPRTKSLWKKLTRKNKFKKTILKQQTR